MRAYPQIFHLKTVMYTIDNQHIELNQITFVDKP